MVFWQLKKVLHSTLYKRVFSLAVLTQAPSRNGAWKHLTQLSISRRLSALINCLPGESRQFTIQLPGNSLSPPLSCRRWECSKLRITTCLHLAVPCSKLLKTSLGGTECNVFSYLNGYESCAVVEIPCFSSLEKESQQGKLARSVVKKLYSSIDQLCGRQGFSQKNTCSSVIWCGHFEENQRPFFAWF